MTLTWDIVDFGKRGAQQREAELAFRDAELALEQAQLEVQRLSASSSVDIERYREAWNAARAEYESATKLVRAADRSFELGVGTVGDSLRALERQIDAEIRLTSRWLEAVLGAAEIAQVNNQLDDQSIVRLSDVFSVQ